MVLAETPPVSPNASIRTRTSPFIDSTLTGPFAVATSTSPLIVDHQGAPRPRHVHVPHHGRRAQARTARQPDCEVHSHVVVASASHFDIAMSRRATAVAIPHGADGNAAVVGHGDEPYARRVRRPVRLHG